jgi:hypothetical protein
MVDAIYVCTTLIGTVARSLFYTAGNDDDLKGGCNKRVKSKKALRKTVPRYGKWRTNMVAYGSKWV